jgi:Flp pilus assembly pilin Flp
MALRGNWLAQDDGQGMVEYALILALTSLGMVLALLLLRESLASPVRGSSNALDAVTAGAPAAADPGGAAGRPLDAGQEPAGAGGSSGTTGKSGQDGNGGPGKGGPEGTWDRRHRSP